jgi:hypothetical protein
MQPEGADGEEFAAEDALGLLAREEPLGGGGAGSDRRRAEAARRQHPLD